MESNAKKLIKDAKKAKEIIEDVKSTKTQVKNAQKRLQTMSKKKDVIKKKLQDQKAIIAQLDPNPVPVETVPLIEEPAVIPADKEPEAEARISASEEPEREQKSNRTHLSIKPIERSPEELAHIERINKTYAEITKHEITEGCGMRVITDSEPCTEVPDPINQGSEEPQEEATKPKKTSGSKSKKTSRSKKPANVKGVVTDDFMNDFVATINTFDV
jgi:hypothetical protein